MQPFIQGASGGWTDGYEPVFSEFSAMDEEGVTLKVNIAEVQVDRFGYPKPRCVEQTDQEPDARAAETSFRAQRFRCMH